MTITLTFYKGGARSGNYGHHGLAGVWGGSTSSGGAPAKKTGRVWTGTQQEKSEKRLSKIETGELGERLAIKAAEEKLKAEFATFNTHVNNSPIDIAGDHTAIEVKTGLASNGKSAQHWRATIGEPGKVEKELLKQMTPEQKRANNTWKRQEILRRKNETVASMSKIAGKEIKGITIGIILSPDATRADVYFIPGFHQRMAWDKYATDEYYVGTYDA